MKKILLALLLFIFIGKIFAQTDSLETGKYFSAKRHFEKEYIKQNYLNSDVKVEKDRIIIDVIKDDGFSGDLGNRITLIFGHKLFSPLELDNENAVQIFSNNELVLLNPNPQTKRFKFWIIPKNRVGHKNSFEYMLQGRANPSEYYFELQNMNADEKTSFEEFIKGSKLTYLAYGGIII
ncbi:hypothetical protein ACNFU2_02380 [Chryseobacterium sp. PTM-20240506]|uniref:hypothetical protein n=1 Tax=unclassified Chryseobacterium TaxID=2593645 RepID=UPI0015537EAD|nr:MULTISPECIES: hypothetical protein [unclassified Chryseobacterium]MDC8103704.1 hypothetical protein [Chryseobacterium sp. B21-037]MDQ1803312.1 hypothetical protein [Chryseobacterium sp. CKR4-1]